ncbi:MAG: tRNA glutamyl-Q(34) synthetase GluQRS [Verrucomicrobiales bacterium]|nr:tRNA glutamyl-Q(34) synthetase GluQRS [Verrucomicrobiales bacterium]|tara:strand:- start:1680 stop:2594 length:915 start_codon:yes stop_codon:yes gene_type:complete
MITSVYRGRIAPTPTGYLHLGHARTFWFAQERAKAAGGTNILRNDDLDQNRCREEYRDAMLEDLKWLGIEWSEGPDIGGDYMHYTQSERMQSYRASFIQLLRSGCVYPCYCSRKDIRTAVAAPHLGEDELLYPGTCRPDTSEKHRFTSWEEFAAADFTRNGRQPAWRFMAQPTAVEFTDLCAGPKSYLPGRDFGDFVVWRQDDTPAYQLACAMDDTLMNISEVVRGTDLLASTARQLLLLEMLEMQKPDYFHCPLMCDEQGKRLAKRADSLSLRRMRQEGADPQAWFAQWESEFGETLLKPTGK